MWNRPSAAARTSRASSRCFGQNTAIQAVGEGNYSSLAQQKRYTDAEVEPMLAGRPYSGGDEVHHTAGDAGRQPGACAGDLPVADFDAAGVRDTNVDAVHPLAWIGGHAGLD